ncbi:MAG TPA: permease prefix domain 1-containing protein, partial [Opitutaceae bacterium]
MRELENRIAAWRETMAAELPAETVRELEEHLREHIAAQCAEGVEPEAAVARAVERLGDTKALAREFARVGSGWLPASRPVFAM